MQKEQSFISKFVKLVVSLSSGLALIVSSNTLLFAQTEQSANQRKTPEAVQTLVAPIALYPDALVAQILAASTIPTEIVQADRWLQKHSDLQSNQLATAVDQQPWDPSVKALTAFPKVLANMDQNLSWTSELGETYFEQQQDVMDAIQVLRQRAEEAGNLQSSAQERIVNEGPSIVIEPGYPDVCYLPVYDPWLVYGAPLVPYPGYFFGPVVAAPFISFGPAIRIGFLSGFGWGWPAWGFNWGSRVVVFNRFPYVPRSSLFFHRPILATGPRVIGPGVVAPRIGDGFGRSRPAFDRNHWNGVNRSNHAGTFRGFESPRFDRGNFVHGGGGRSFSRSGGGRRR